MKPTRLTTILSVFLLFSAAGAAQTTVDTNPGLITADSPLYELDVALDQVLKSPGERAHERASEALVAQEANLTDSRDRALAALNQTAGQANGLRDGTGLENAQALLTELKEQVPVEAQQGLQTAIDAVIEAKNRYPTDRGPNDTGPKRPDQQERGI